MRSARTRRKTQEATVCSAAGFSTSGPLTDCTAVVPPAPTEKATSTVPTALAMRAKGGATGRRPRTRSGTPGSSVTSRMAETPFSGGRGGGGGVMTSTGGGAAASAGDGVGAACAGGGAIAAAVVAGAVVAAVASAGGGGAAAGLGATDPAPAVPPAAGSGASPAPGPASPVAETTRQ